MTSTRVVKREQRNYLSIAKRESASGEFVHTSTEGIRLRLRRVPRWGGMGALAWRQLVGVRRQWGSVLTAMIAPAILAAAPCFVIAEPNIAFLATAGTLAFYTFLLLPTALRFDFRRDLDRLSTLKGLPISPAAAVLGQTIAPVLVATLFQCVVLAFAVVARSLPSHFLVGAMLALLPLNVLVFAPRQSDLPALSVSRAARRAGDLCADDADVYWEGPAVLGRAGGNGGVGIPGGGAGAGGRH